MAIHANSTTVPAIATALSMQADAVAKTKISSIQSVADVLATLMADIHGGTWRAFVDHGSGTSFVLIRPNNESPIAKPRCGEVA